MARAREFHLGDILSVTTGILVSPGRMPHLHEFLDYLTGESLFTHQLPRAADVCAPWLREQFPDLAAIDASEMTPVEADAWLDEQVAHFGACRAVAPLPTGRWERRNPISDLLGMMGGGIGRT